MPLLPADLPSLVGLGIVGATLGVALFTDWPKAYTLGVASVLAFGLQFFTCTGEVACLGLDGLALSTNALSAGAWWTPITYAFLHASLFHLFGNLFILLTAGPALEDSIGPRWFLAIYGLGALAAAGAGIGLSLASTLVSSQTLMVGSSGAIFAVLTAYAVRHPREKLPAILVFFVMWLPSMIVLLIFLFLNLAYVFTETNVAWYGHFAGFLVGLAIASSGVGRAKRPHVRGLALEGLGSLARTPKAKEALSHLSGLQPGEDAVAAAWLDVLARESRCPVCAKALVRRGLAVECTEGHPVSGAGGAG